MKLQMGPRSADRRARNQTTALNGLGHRVRRGERIVRQNNSRYFYNGPNQRVERGRRVIPRLGYCRAESLDWGSSSPPQSCRPTRTGRTVPAISLPRAFASSSKSGGGRMVDRSPIDLRFYCFRTVHMLKVFLSGCVSCVLKYTLTTTVL